MSLSLLTAALNCTDENGYELVVRRVVWKFEIGYIDGGGIGHWMGTTQSLPFRSKELAEKHRDLLLTLGVLECTRWGEVRVTNQPCSVVRIIRTEEPV